MNPAALGLPTGAGDGAGAGSGTPPAQPAAPAPAAAPATAPQGTGTPTPPGGSGAPVPPAAPTNEAVDSLFKSWETETPAAPAAPAAPLTPPAQPEPAKRPWESPDFQLEKVGVGEFVKAIQEDTLRMVSANQAKQQQERQQAAAELDRQWAQIAAVDKTVTMDTLVDLALELQLPDLKAAYRVHHKQRAAAAAASGAQPPKPAEPVSTGPGGGSGVKGINYKLLRASSDALDAIRRAQGR